jgi:hypothetical protein
MKGYPVLMEDGMTVRVLLRADGDGIMGDACFDVRPHETAAGHSYEAWRAEALAQTGGLDLSEE